MRLREIISFSLLTLVHFNVVLFLCYAFIPCSILINTSTYFITVVNFVRYDIVRITSKDGSTIDADVASEVVVPKSIKRL